MTLEYKLDIFKVLNAANSKNQKFYQGLTEEERKAFIPSVTTRWMSGTSNAGQVMLINEFLNPYVFSLYKHPQLLWQLMTICNIGKSQKYTWNKLPGKKISSKPNAQRAIMQYYGYSSNEAATVLQLMDREDILAIAADLGYQSEEISKIKKEVKSTIDKSDLASQPMKPNEPPLLDF